MKKFLGELKAARNIEWFLAILAIAVLLLRLSAILSRIEGAGSVEAMISEDGSNGVLIVAEGADDLGVCLHLQYAVQTLLGTESSRIEIVPYQK